MTLGEFLQVYSDIDAYLSRGGKFLDLELVELPPVAEQLLERVATPEQKAGLVRWFMFLAGLGERTHESAQKMGEVYSERDLRKLWDVVKQAEAQMKSLERGEEDTLQ
jgi:hypothetical protein